MTGWRVFWLNPWGDPTLSGITDRDAWPTGTVAARCPEGHPEPPHPVCFFRLWCSTSTG